MGRRETFEYYRDHAPCSYAITVEVNVTDLNEAVRRVSRKAYVAQIWAIATAVNRYKEFRMTTTVTGAPATWPVVNPAFTVFNPSRETFATVWAPYDPDFDRFHDRAAALLASASAATAAFPLGDLPANSFDISSVPWTNFTGFSLHIDGGANHLLPIFTLGRYVQREGRTMLPLAVQINHAAADGFHTARLIGDIEQLAAAPTWVH